MNKYLKVLFTFFIWVLILYAFKVEANMPLAGRIIVIDVGHGKEDVGTSYGNIYEKDLNLKIGKYLEESLSKLGSSVIMTRDGDYDLSKPNSEYRKKSDFDNRIKVINESNGDLYISIHINYLSDASYKGAQVFFTKDNEDLAKVIQEEMNKELNGNRMSKKIPNKTYMYNKLKIKGVLIECGFLSNKEERKLLISSDYQKKVASSISKGIINYFK